MDLKWGYDQTDWAKINSTYLPCKAGKSQSPVKIDQVLGSAELRFITFHYNKTDLSIDKKYPYLVFNISSINYIIFSGIKYVLKSIAFHFPAEHQIGALKSDGEIQFIHENSKGQKLHLSILAEDGSHHSELEQVVKNLNERNISDEIKNFWPQMILPRRQGYYFYTGSETTPPCHEGLTWIVMEEKIQLSPRQLNIFESKFRQTARPIQNRYSRKIMRSR